MLSYKALSIIKISLLSSALIGNAALAQQSNKQYSIKVIDNCQFIAEILLNSQQTTAYLALKNEEHIMGKLEASMPAIEEQLNKYKKLNYLTNKHLFHVNETPLVKQKLIAKKLDQLIALHQVDFDAIRAQGKRIGKIADKFSQLVKPTIAHIKHSHINIGLHGEVPKYDTCNGDIAAVTR